jgi:hypothetical protein
MAYLINNYDGTPLVTIQDRTVDIAATSLRLPGRDYRPYGETVVENLVWMLQHFANSAPPDNAIDGQLWYDTNSRTVRVRDATTSSWLTLGRPQTGNSLPSSGQAAQLFYHTLKKQLFVFDEDTANWRLLAPIGARDGTDPIGAAATNTAMEAAVILDAANNPHKVIRITVGGTLTAIISEDAFSAGILGFEDPLSQGINLRLGHNFKGVATQAVSSTNSARLGNIPAVSYMRRDQNNDPITDNTISLGSEGRRWSTVHATSFVGTASFALAAGSATTSTTASSAVTANNAILFNGNPASFYTNAGNITSGTLGLARLPYVPVNKGGDTMTGVLQLAGDPNTGMEAATKNYVDSRVASVTGLAIYESSPFGISNSGVYVLNHGLGVSPKFVTVDLTCITLDGGYTPGAVIQIGAFADPRGDNEGLAIQKTTSQVIIRIGNNGPGEYVRGDGSGGGFVIIAARWQMTVRAYS